MASRGPIGEFGRIPPPEAAFQLSGHLRTATANAPIIGAFIPASFCSAIVRMIHHTSFGKCYPYTHRSGNPDRTNPHFRPCNLTSASQKDTCDQRQTTSSRGELEEAACRYPERPGPRNDVDLSPQPLADYRTAPANSDLPPFFWHSNCFYAFLGVAVTARVAVCTDA